MKQEPTSAHRPATALFRLTPIASVLAGALLAPTVWAADAAPVLAAQAATGAAASSAAQNDEAPKALEAVVVRSRNRIEKLQDVPLSVSVVQGNELTRLDATDITEITKRAGNISWNQGNQRTSSISIRGVGKVGQTEAQDPSVGFMVDGIAFAYNALTSSFDFNDVDTVEVTRGPQGTLLGKNTSMGVVAINTKRPSFTPSADYSLTLRDRDGVSGFFAGGGPVIDDVLAWRGTFSFSKQRGDFVNTYDRDRTYGNTDRVSGRLQFLYKPTADFSARIALDAQPRSGEATNGRTVNFPTKLTTYADGTAVPVSTTSTEAKLGRRWFAETGLFTVDDFYNGDSKTVTVDGARPLVTGSHGAVAELNWKLGNGATVTSISAVKDYHFNAYNDDSTPFDVRRNAGGYWNDYQQKSQEVRYTSPLGGLVDYQAGLYFIKVDNDATYNVGWGNDAGAWNASKSQYDLLDATSSGRDLLRESLANTLGHITANGGEQKIRNKSTALFGQANWHLSDELTVTTGLRLTNEERNNRVRSVITENGSAPELNPAYSRKTFIGGFFSNSSTGALSTDPWTGAGNSDEQLRLADKVASKYYGKAATATPGEAYNSLTAAQKKEVATAKAIRQSALGVLYDWVEAKPFNKLQKSAVISPSYKFNPDVTGYFSWQYGEKAGIAQINNGESNLVKPERTNAFELGLKTALLNKTLVLNADLFLLNVNDYQQSVRVVDQYTTDNDANNAGLNPGDAGYKYTYTSQTGNVPKLQVSGLEVDGVYTGIRNVTLRFSGAYNRAIFKKFPNAAKPDEEGNTADPYKDVSGRLLPGAPLFSFNVGGDYRVPVFADKEAHVSANVAWTGSSLSDNSLSKYSRIPSNTKVDLAFGLGKRDKKFDVSFIVKNAFGDDTPTSQSASSYSPAKPRSYALQFTGKL